MNLCLSFVQRDVYCRVCYGMFHNYSILQLDVSVFSCNTVVQLLVHFVEQDSADYGYSYRYSDFDQNSFHGIVSQV